MQERLHENPDLPKQTPDPEQPETPEAPKGRYTRDERKHFKAVLGPGAAVALESLRQQAGIRITATKHT